MAKTKQIHQDGFSRFNCIKPTTNVVFTLIFILLAVITFLPVVFVFIISISSEASIAQNGYSFFPADDIHTVRLGHKIICAVFQGGDFIVLTVFLRHDDYRDERKHRILSDDIQKGVAIHHRHHNIQQNQSDAVLALPQNIQSYLPVFRFQHLIGI